MNSATDQDTRKAFETIKGKELNSWRRGFTPQAEIWNGRMASIGIAIALFILLASNYNFIN